LGAAPLCAGWCPLRCCVLCPPGCPPPDLRCCGPLRWALAASPCGGFWPCVPVPPCGVVPPCVVVRVRAFSPFFDETSDVALDTFLCATACTLPAHAMGGSGPPYAYGSCGAQPEQAYLGTGSHHHEVSDPPTPPTSNLSTYEYTHDAYNTGFFFFFFFYFSCFTTLTPPSAGAQRENN